MRRPPARLAMGALLIVAGVGCTLIAGVDDVELRADAGAMSGGAAATGGASQGGPTSASGMGGAAGAAGCKSTYRDAVLSDGPIAYWRLGEKKGLVAHNEIGNVDDGVYVDVGLGVPGALSCDPDTAAQFNGTDAYL